MTTPLCSRADVKIATQSADDSVDDDLLDRYIDVATDSIQRVTGRSFAQVHATDEIVRYPNATLDKEGRLRLRLRTPRITAVSALAVRRGTPAAAWTALDLSIVDFDPDPFNASSLVRAYTSLPPAGAALWARLSYTAGWVGDLSDPFPPDLQELALWWAVWLYRTKDAPFEKTANPQAGTVTIPSALPARLRLALVRWTLSAAV